jgi:drug/metabolite transporter (DMT)-like permease
MTAASGKTQTSLLGDALALLAAVTWMAATIWPAALIKKYGQLRASFWLFGSAFLLTVPLGASTLPEALDKNPSLLAWGGLIYAAVFGLVIGNMLWQRAVQQLGGAGTLVYLYLQPVGAMVLAALTLGERLSPFQALGGALALLGVALVKRD